MSGPPTSLSHIPPGLSAVSVSDVLSIYELIVQDFASADDPISPAGVRDHGLLESAVHRQFTGYDGRFKYTHPLSSAASLTFALCCDHPFHNGNKRAALVSMLVHLDRNDYVLEGVRQSDLYSAMIDIANHSLGLRGSAREHGRPTPDMEVAAIHRWLRDRARPIQRGERVLTYRQLRRAVGQFGIQLEIVDANRAVLVRYEDRPTGIFRKLARVRTRVCDVGYRDEGTDIPKSQMKRIRESCALTEEHGIDSQAFYSTGVVVDEFICRYRRVLRRLARA